MEGNVLHLGWMWPNLMNLHGERGSVQSFVRQGKKLGLEVQVHRIENPEDPIPFEQLDLIIFLPGELKVIGKLKPYIEEQISGLKEYMDRGGYIIAIGTTGMLFGQQVTREDGSILEGLKLLPVSGTERRYVLGDDLQFSIPGLEHDIIGSQIQMVNVKSDAPLGKTIYGFGNDGTGTEGARVKNLIYTNCLGPVFAKNPWWAESILRDIAGDRIPADVKPEYCLEEASFKTTVEFLKSKQGFKAK